MEMSEKTSDFNYDLPPELIAQTPIDRREMSRLMCLDAATGKTEHRRFLDVAELLRQGDCLVLNDSRVLPARLREGKTEVLLLRDLGDGLWECLTRPGKKTGPGVKLSFGSGELTAQVESVSADGNRLVRFNYEGDFLEKLERHGRTPLPPYITAELDDPERYQTVYSRRNGSAAAPTAGLHFTCELLDKIAGRGVAVCFVTLHVGVGTFRPVRAEYLRDHKMHAEYYTIPEETARIINEAKAGGGRIVAVGTTSCRTLESCADESGNVMPTSGSTDLFISPGYRFKCADALITNFHLPESTLIMLVSALAGRENVLAAYKEAIRERYRFYSFGDAMLIY